MLIQDLELSLSRTGAHRSAVAEAVWCDDSQPHVYEHRDLVAPSHGDVWEAMDLERDSALNFFDVMA